MELKDYPMFLSIKNVAEILQIGSTQVYTLLNNNEIKATKIGNKWRVPRESIEEYRNKILNNDKN